MRTPKRVPTSRVEVPRNNPAGRVRTTLGFPRLPMPHPARRQTSYKKVKDPFDPAGAGFGDTGLTGES